MIGQVIGDRYHLTADRIMFKDNRILSLCRRADIFEVNAFSKDSIGIYSNVLTYYDDEAGLSTRITTFRNIPFRISRCG